ncbi:hypothetical protein [Ruegeria arenilitoris]|uniref:hypothetical protein n=1 Tax=Ruegeria arenilitoris TaxID=1173585 RepID=UPI00147F0C80|nr:hypothetical protein [Ruegeria arenilitoris]
MKHLFLPITAISALAAQPVHADELLGSALIEEISGQHFDCMMGETPLEWIVSDVTLDATSVPYSAIVRGKTVEAEYSISVEGRLTSDGYGDERRVEKNADGSLSVARSDGRVMKCTAR